MRERGIKKVILMVKMTEHLRRDLCYDFNYLHIVGVGVAAMPLPSLLILLVQKNKIILKTFS